MGGEHLAEALGELDTPFRQFAEMVDGGGGRVTLDTGKAKAAMPTVLSLCAKAGYKANEDA